VQALLRPGLLACEAHDGLDLLLGELAFEARHDSSPLLDERNLIVRIREVADDAPIAQLWPDATLAVGTVAPRAVRDEDLPTRRGLRALLARSAPTARHRNDADAERASDTCPLQQPWRHGVVVVRSGRPAPWPPELPLL